ncbi:MAG: thioesterase family protein [Ilumatobacter sp.]|uniref:thioesterase family protein n=1 Tax=Ilumatobacter sp. TaxID=1967498 RepID=UPI00391BD167
MSSTGDVGGRDTLFVPADGAPAGAERWVPTELARGPWDPTHCHGGPTSALLARAAERAGEADDPVDWQIARLTVELVRGVPVGRPLDLITEVERPGRKVSLVAARLLDGDTEVARMRSLRVRCEAMPLPPHPRIADDELGLPGDGRLVTSEWDFDGGDDVTAFHRDSCEHRFVTGSWDEFGPCSVWIRLLVDVVPGETPSGVQRVAAAADFGNGVSGSIPAEDFTYINPDLTVHLARPPVGDWVGMVTHSLYGTPIESTGAGYAESALYDADGRLGRSVQSLIIQPR